MNKLTLHQNTILTHFKLKPLLVAIPITVLAACANTPESEQPNDLNSAVIYEEATYTETTVSEPELTSTNLTTEENVAEDNINTENNISNATKGNAQMTVLVIENPELLAKSMLRPNKRVFHFGFNQTSLSEEDIELVEKHADYLKANPELKVTIHGHTDTQGNSDYNLKLSEKRALMLVNQLKKFGINNNRIETIGWGGNYPLVNSLNFSENRRIEIEYSETHYAANH
jgi:outer membrane protein OmpA-like peptidoglycan-associated protein